jgi:hypothetical protein
MAIFKRRRLLAAILAAGVAPMVFVPRSARAAIHNPANYGVIGAGNDTPAFNAALTAIRLDGRGILELRAPLYVTDSNNATNLNNLEIYCEPGTVIEGTAMTAAAPLLDCTKSHNVRVVGGDWRGGSMTKAAFLAALGDRFFFDGVLTKGYFSSGTLCIIAASSVGVRGAQLYNQHAQSPVLNISNQGDWGISSIYDSTPYVSTHVGDIKFDFCEFHALGFQRYTSYFRNANAVKFDGGVHDNNGGANGVHMLFQGTCARNTVDTLKFYKELAIAQQSLAMFECNSPDACQNLRVTNCPHDFIPNVRVGNGDWSGFEMSPP